MVVQHLDTHSGSATEPSSVQASTEPPSSREDPSHQPESPCSQQPPPCQRDLRNVALPHRGDINTAAALRAQYAINTPKPSRRRHKKAMNTTASNVIIDEDTQEPVLDQTATLPLHSKKTERLQRKQQKRTERLMHQQSTTLTLLSLPSELLTEIFSHLLPIDIGSLLLTSHDLHTFTSIHETTIARNIIRQRYYTLQRCFHVPIPLSSVPADAHSALLSPKRLEMLNIHRKSYHQHVQMIDPTTVCTCMTCVFAWNNLCLIIDLHHWQPHLENREPLPIIPRGTNPAWNLELLDRNARLVKAAMHRDIAYARVLQMHLETTVQTIVRNARLRKKLPASNVAKGAPIGDSPLAASSTTSFSRATSTSTSTSTPKPSSSSKPRLYRLTDTDVVRGIDEFLERSGPPSYDFPFMRDNYYSLEAYCPNRKWSAETGRWHYYDLAPGPHERDLEWVRSWAVGAGFRG